MITVAMCQDLFFGFFLLFQVLSVSFQFWSHVLFLSSLLQAQKTVSQIL